MDWLPLAVKRCLLCGHELVPRAKSPLPACSREGREIRAAHVLCQACQAELVPIQGRRCACCGIKLFSETTVCTSCRERQYVFSAHRSLFPYRGIIKEIIYQFKFQKQKVFTGLLAHYLALALEEMGAGMLSPALPAAGSDRLPLVPVPASKVKTGQKASGFVRADWGTVPRLCAYLKENYGYTVYDCLICLGKAPQKELDFTTRLQNVKGRFALKEKKKRQGTGSFRLPEQMVLLDDIFTTGATVNECASVLLAAGVSRVYVLTLAMD